MDATIGKDVEVRRIVEAALRGDLPPTQAKRLRRHAEHIFCFLDYADVPWENNLAERQIRPAVILRKNSQSNRSERGAATQAILMSVYRTLKLRGQDPTDVIVDALRTYVTTGQLPPLPS